MNLSRGIIISLFCIVIPVQVALRATHWTQETEELRSKWMQTPEDMERIRKNVQTIK